MWHDSLPFQLLLLIKALSYVLIFSHLEAVSRYCDPQLQVSKNVYIFFENMSSKQIKCPFLFLIFQIRKTNQKAKSAKDMIITIKVITGIDVLFSCFCLIQALARYTHFVPLKKGVSATV